jgi:hypothetical protein
VIETLPNKPSVRGVRVILGIVALCAALIIPAQAAMAEEDCTNVRSDPTAAQYCAVQGVNAGSKGDQAGGGPQDSGSGPATSGQQPVVAAVAVESPMESSSAGSLPFTGLDVGILIAVAGALGGAGLLLHRLTGSGVPRG